MPLAVLLAVAAAPPPWRSCSETQRRAAASSRAARPCRPRVAREGVGQHGGERPEEETQWLPRWIRRLAVCCRAADRIYYRDCETHTDEAVSVGSGGPTVQFKIVAVTCLPASSSSWSSPHVSQPVAVPPRSDGDQADGLRREQPRQLLFAGDRIYVRQDQVPHSACRMATRASRRPSASAWLTLSSSTATSVNRSRS